MKWKKQQRTLGKYDVDKLKNEKTLRTFQETAINFLERSEGSDKEQFEESWKVM